MLGLCVVDVVFSNTLAQMMFEFKNASDVNNNYLD